MFGKIKQFFLFWKIDRQLVIKYKKDLDFYKEQSDRLVKSSLELINSGEEFKNLAITYRSQRNEVARAYAGTIRNILRHDKQGVISRKEASELLEALENIR